MSPNKTGKSKREPSIPEMCEAMGAMGVAMDSMAQYTGHQAMQDYMVDVDKAHEDNLSMRKEQRMEAGGRFKKCPGCGGKGERRCTGCYREAYCSEECQRSEWRKGHKKVCGDIRRCSKKS